MSGSVVEEVLVLVGCIFSTECSEWSDLCDCPVSVLYSCVAMVEDERIDRCRFYGYSAFMRDKCEIEPQRYGDSQGDKSVLKESQVHDTFPRLFTQTPFIKKLNTLRGARQVYGVILSRLHAMRSGHYSWAPLTSANNAHAHALGFR